MAKQMRDFVGEIKRITDTTGKEYIAKTGKNAGNKFTVWSIGICLDDGSWHNLKDTKKDKMEEGLINPKTNKLFRVGDTIKIFEEAEDAEGQYWKIASIALHNPNDEVPVEDVLEQQQLGETSEGVPTGASHVPEKKSEPAPKQGFSGVKGAEDQAKLSTKITPEQREEMYKKGEKDMKAVKDYNEEEKNKYILGMALNNAATIFAAAIQSSKIESTSKEAVDVFEEVQAFVKEHGDFYDELVRALYKKGLMLRKELIENDKQTV